MTDRPHRTANVVMIAALLAAALVGCRREPGPETLRQAWKLVAARQFDGALPLAKEYLVWHPAAGDAHYVLGQCFLHQQNVNTTLAKGEFETALYVFDKYHDLGILASEMTPDQFQSALHRDIALALMRALYEGDGHGVPAQRMRPVLEEALRQTREALRFEPSSGFLQDMERTLDGLHAGRSSIPPPPTPSEGPGEITI